VFIRCLCFTPLDFCVNLTGFTVLILHAMIRSLEPSLYYDFGSVIVMYFLCYKSSLVHSTIYTAMKLSFLANFVIWSC